MSKRCINCGKELKDSAKYCGKCGSKVEDEIKELKCRNCGYEIREDAKFCTNCGVPVESIDRSGATTTEKSEKVENYHRKFVKYSDKIKSNGKGFVKDIRNFKTLSKKKKWNVALILGGFLAIVILVFILFKPGVSDKVVSQAALEIAEQDYGYKLELTSYDIVDSFTAKGESINGDTVKAKMYLVIVEGNAKDEAGNVVETVKYGVTVVDPKKSGEYVVYDTTSEAQNCTDIENKEIEEMLKSGTAHLH